MKILSITAQKPHSTGSGTYLTELVRNFDALGCEQAVVAGVYPDDAVDFPAGVTFYPVYLPYPIVGMSDLMPYDSTRYCDMTESMIQDFRELFVKEISRAVDELKPDIVICHHLFLLTSIVREAFPNLTVCGICHGTCLRQMRNAAESGDWAIDIDEISCNIRRLDHIFALHSEQAEEIAKIFEIEPSSGQNTATPITVIGSGYNPEIFNTRGREARTQNDPVRIVYAGKVSTPKGVPELLAAIEEIENDKANSTLSVPDFEITLVGGCQEASLREALARFNYLGPVNQRELAEIYKKNDVLVLPSFFEGLSLVPIEAMASGLIPICTDLPGMKPWIDSQVLNPNVRYIPRPEMASIDRPTEQGRSEFVNNLKEVLIKTIKDVSAGRVQAQPDTSKITWREVANSILEKLQNF